MKKSLSKKKSKRPTSLPAASLVRASGAGRPNLSDGDLGDLGDLGDIPMNHHWHVARLGAP